MNTEITGDEPAMPEIWLENKLTEQQKVCVQLELPETGVEWLDKLITKKQRQSIAVKAMEGLLANEKYTMALQEGKKAKGIDPFKAVASHSVNFTDALLSELNKTVEP